MIGSGKEYFGTARQTRHGMECKPWNVYGKNHSDLGPHNFCRNPSGAAEGVWCHTANPSKEIDFCDVRQCTDQDTSRLQAVSFN